MQRITVKAKAILTTLILFSISGLIWLNDGDNRVITNLILLYGQNQPRQQQELNDTAEPLSCADPTRNSAGLCREIEHDILATIIRIEIEMWIKQPLDPEGSGLYEYRQARGIGHGTIKGGRYLVTHNHFDMPLPTPDAPPAFDYGIVRLFKANGEELTFLNLDGAFTVSRRKPETLVLDFGKVNGNGFFTAMGLPSAKFSTWQEVALKPGMTVAQIDWDGRRANIKWVMIEAIKTEYETVCLELASSLTPGASGGGVFWNGYHIANNWKVIKSYDQGGDLVSLQSEAALN